MIVHGIGKEVYELSFRVELNLIDFRGINGIYLDDLFGPQAVGKVLPHARISVLLGNGGITRLVGRFVLGITYRAYQFVVLAVEFDQKQIVSKQFGIRRRHGPTCLKLVFQVEIRKHVGRYARGKEEGM